MPVHVSNAMCSSSEGENCIIQHVIITLCRWPSDTQVERGCLNLCTGRPPTGVMIPDAI